MMLCGARRAMVSAPASGNRAQPQAKIIGFVTAHPATLSACAMASTIRAQVRGSTSRPPSDLGSPRRQSPTAPMASTTGVDRRRSRSASSRYCWMTGTMRCTASSRVVSMGIAGILLVRGPETFSCVRVRGARALSMDGVDGAVYRRKTRSYSAARAGAGGAGAPAPSGSDNGLYVFHSLALLQIVRALCETVATTKLLVPDLSLLFSIYAES